MSLKDTLHRAAEIFVDMPDKPEKEEPAKTPPPAAEPGGMDDIDRRLAEMSQRLSGGNVTPASPAKPVPAPTIEPLEENEAVSALAGADVSAALTPEGALDIASVYEQSGVTKATFTAEQALDMIHSLPANLPVEVKKQTLQVTIGSMGKAIGATPETILADAAAKWDALKAYAAETARQAEDFAQAAEFEIAEMEKQIEAKRAAIFDTRNRQSQVKQQCEAEAQRLSEIRTFLSTE